MEYNKSIYFFGPCIIVGRYAEDAHTIESYLQGMINEAGYNIRVVNYGSFSSELSLMQRICQTEFKKGDIVILYDRSKSFDAVHNVNFVDCLERENISAKWMIDNPKHCNYKVNKLYAQEIYNFIEDKFKEETTGEMADTVEIPKDILINTYVERYFSDFNVDGTVGSIVMNCNPFTRGHRYLIEQALKMVDHLIIFVVEEDKSMFTFKERYAMVREGTKDLKDITVVPSGNFILSQTTFPEYFLKIEDKDIEHNVEYDITLFAEAIVPRLNITYRFVGEEKTDKVTDRYNLAMKKILPEHGIHIVEIPRKTASNGSGEVISATTVRKMLEYPIDDNIDDLIPESTRKLLVRSWE
jgi:[citrate (pro-3S)-lyase] ligase